MLYLNLKKSKSGHPRMQNPIMLFLIAPPGNPYILSRKWRYINFSIWRKNEK